MREGVTVKVGHAADTGVDVFEHTLSQLGAPQRFTVSRTKIVLFGESDFDTATVPATKLAHDFFGSLPTAELRFVDATPWRLDELVVNTVNGPRLVTSEDERVTLTSAPNRYAILKHQTALRHSLANTGRGLADTVASSGDNSPYSFGTSIALGWVRQGDGNYVDIHNGPAAGGWTGWSAIWMGECGNVFAHEVGHSMTLSHFTNGSANNWGIADEYPQDGVNLDTHPWGYHSLWRQPRTWYKVTNAGAVSDSNGIVGKRDPMNGGGDANAVTCFPQYTAYHAEKVQAWSQSSPTLSNVNGVAGAWQWNEVTRQYEPATVDPAFGVPLEVDVPVMTLVGTLGNVDSACQTYPPMFSSSGNVFTRPDPATSGLASVFDGARWFLAITYADNSVEHALIARGEMLGTDLGLYSVNLPLKKSPTKVDLYRADAAYPSLDVNAAQLIHTRVISTPADPIPAVVTAGRQWLANGGLNLHDRCSPSIDCDERGAESTWRTAAPIHFEEANAQGQTGEVCSTVDDVLSVAVPVLLDGTSETSLVVHAQRVMRSGHQEVAVPLDDVTPWFSQADAEQTLRMWIPYQENKALQPGHYTNKEAVRFLGGIGATPFSDTPLVIDLQVYATTEVNLASEFVGQALTSTGSSVYFLIEDPSMGPTNRVWYGGSDPTSLSVPMVDDANNALVSMKLEAEKEACGTRWELNSGQAVNSCSHAAVLRIATTGNEQLVSGHTYRSPGSSPLVVEGRRWHQPNAEALIERFAYSLVYQAP